jgi:hypothetical protein
MIIILILIVLACVFQIGRWVGQAEGMNEASGILLDLTKEALKKQKR